MKRADRSLPTKGNLTTGFLLSVLGKRKTLYKARDLRKRMERFHLKQPSV